MGAPALNLQTQYNVDTKLCYPFIEALTHTLKTLCNIDVKMGKPSFKSASTDDVPNISIQAAIATKTTLAQVAIAMNYKFFFIVMGRMLGETYKEMTPELEDGAKELMNVAFNQAKKPLAEKGMAAIRSIPSIVIGDKLALRYLTRGQTIVLPMVSDYGHFTIEITSQEISESDRVTGG